jgi:hypothetical protein
MYIYINIYYTFIYNTNKMWKSVRRVLEGVLLHLRPILPVRLVNNDSLCLFTTLVL